MLLDFENPSDADLNNVYEVTVRVTDAVGLSTDQTIDLVVNDANDPPLVTSDGAVRTQVDVAENQTAVTPGGRSGRWIFDIFDQWRMDQNKFKLDRPLVSLAF